MGFRGKLQHSSFVLAIIGTALVILCIVVVLAVSIYTHKGYGEKTKPRKSDVQSATVIKKPILASFKSDVKSATVIKKRIWTTFKKVQANSVPPLDTIYAIKLHFKLESDDKTIPLMIRTAAGANGKLASKVVGSSGIINQLVTEKQTFYVSVSDPSIKYRIRVLGYIEKPPSGVLKKLP